MKSHRPTKKLGKNKNENISTWWNVKKTEAGWIEATNKFFLRYAPKWFKFLGWLILLSALKYIERISESRFLSLLYGISFMFLYFYLQALLYNFPFYKFLPAKLVRSERFARFAFIFSITAAAPLFLFWFYLLEKIIDNLAIK